MTDKITAPVSREVLEPTAEMMAAGERAWKNRNLSDPDSNPVRDCYMAMAALTVPEAKPLEDVSLAVLDDMDHEYRIQQETADWSGDRMRPDGSRFNASGVTTVAPVPAEGEREAAEIRHATIVECENYLLDHYWDTLEGERQILELHIKSCFTQIDALRTQPVAETDREAIALTLWKSRGGIERVWNELKDKHKNPDDYPAYRTVQDCWRDTDAILALRTGHK